MSKLASYYRGIKDKKAYLRIGFSLYFKNLEVSLLMEFCKDCI